jgi:hypothetical protein
MRPHLLVCLLGFLPAACAGPQPTPADPLPEYASTLAASVDDQLATLGREVRLAFPVGGHEAQLAGEALDQLAIDLRMQALGWRALETHAQEMRQVLSHPGTEGARIEGLTVAFRELHLRLIQTGMGEDLGIGLEQQQRTERNMLLAGDSAAAIAVSLPALQQLLEGMNRAGEPLEQRLEQDRRLVLALHAQANQAVVDRHHYLSERRTELERRLAAVAAGVAPMDHEAEQELAAMSADWQQSEQDFADYEQRQRTMEEAFRRAKDHVRGIRSATLEWGVALREVGKALERDRDQANLRLIEASVEELGNGSLRLEV